MAAICTLAPSGLTNARVPKHPPCRLTMGAPLTPSPHPPRVLRYRTGQRPAIQLTPHHLLPPPLARCVCPMHTRQPLCPPTRGAATPPHRAPRHRTQLHPSANLKPAPIRNPVTHTVASSQGRARSRTTRRWQCQGSRCPTSCASPRLGATPNAPQPCPQARASPPSGTPCRCDKMHVPLDKEVPVQL